MMKKLKTKCPICGDIMCANCYFRIIGNADELFKKGVEPSVCLEKAIEYERLITDMFKEDM